MKYPLAILLSTLWTSSALPAASLYYFEDFTTGLNGWSTAGSSKGSDPPSSLAHNHIDNRASYLDTAAGIGYYLAPTILTGDLTGSYGGSMDFEILIPAGMDTGHSDSHAIHMDAFIWSTNGDVLVFDLSQPADGLSGAALSPFLIPINDSAGWAYLDANSNYSDSTLFSTLDVPHPAIATQAEIMTILGSVSQIGFRAEFSDGIDSTAGSTPGTAGFNPESELLSFSFGSPSPVPEPSGALLISLASLLALRRKR